MYFSDISNSELAHYHNQIKNNFELPFSEMIGSAMFKVETIISNKLYKVYPLFYCESITSTNPNDEIMENKCIICQHNTDTLFSFITNLELPSDIVVSWDMKLWFTGVIVQVYDRITGKGLKGAKVEGSAEYTENNELIVSEFEGITNDDGVSYSQFYRFGQSNLELDALKITLSDGTVVVDYTRSD